MTAPMLTALLLACALTLPVGCGDDITKLPPPDDEVGETAEPDEVCKSSCQECAEFMKDAYTCMALDESEPLTNFECIVCDNDGWGSAAITCGTQANLQSIYYTTMEAQLVACENSMAQPKCVDWTPSRHVHPGRANEWEVERDLIAALVADPSQLTGCDEARVKFSAGSYVVVSVGSDDLLGQLGLANDDVIQSINGYMINGPFDAAQAFFGLWPDTREFTVCVHRPGVGDLTFTYNLV